MHKDPHTQTGHDSDFTDNVLHCRCIYAIMTEFIKASLSGSSSLCLKTPATTLKAKGHKATICTSAAQDSKQNTPTHTHTQLHTCTQKDRRHRSLSYKGMEIT